MPPVEAVVRAAVLEVAAPALRCLRPEEGGAAPPRPAVERVTVRLLAAPEPTVVELADCVIFVFLYRNTV